MTSVSPLATALFIVLGVALAGAVVAYVRDRTRFSGYRHLMADAVRLARALRGEIFRDGADLVISGTWKTLPVMVRFSHAENTPGLDIRMGAPATFSLSVAPSRAQDVTDRPPLRTSDESFNARFRVRSDDPTHARMFIDGRQALACLRKLCRSAQTYLQVTPGLVELSELGLPDRESTRGVLEQIATLGALAQELRAMPGAETVKIETLKRHHSIAFRLALALGIVAALGAILMAARPGAIPRLIPAGAAIPTGIWPSDAIHMYGVKDWRLAGADDFDPVAVSWLRGSGQKVGGRIPGDYCGTGAENSVAYVLAGANNTRRLVLLCRGQNRLDAIYPYIGLAARIPHEVFSTIKWSGNPPLEPEGDGLLVLRAPDSPASGLVFFTRGGQIQTAVPLNYQSIKLD